VVIFLNEWPVAPRAADPTPAAASPLEPLGHYLFQSTSLSADGTVACSTCHIARFGFSGDKAEAVGVAGFTTHRRAPSLRILRGATVLMWDGRASSLAAQVQIPLESPEMAVDWTRALASLADDPAVKRLTEAAGLTRLDRSAMIAALAAYVASLAPGTSRFDRFFYRHDAAALTDQEAQELRLFVRKARCASCHRLDGNAASQTAHASPVRTLCRPLRRSARTMQSPKRPACGSVQSGFNRVALRAPRQLGATRAHRTLQIHPDQPALPSAAGSPVPPSLSAIQMSL